MKVTMTQKDRIIFHQIIGIKRQISYRMRDIDKIHMIDEIFQSESDKYLIQVNKSEIELLEDEIKALEKKLKPQVKK